jgi:AMP-binding enzyme
MADTVVTMFRERARKSGDRDAFKVKRNGEWSGITWNRYEELVRAVSNGLLSLGLDRGDNIAIISLNRHELAAAGRLHRRTLGVEGDLRRERGAARQDLEDPQRASGAPEGHHLRPRGRDAR